METGKNRSVVIAVIVLVVAAALVFAMSARNPDATSDSDGGTVPSSEQSQSTSTVSYSLDAVARHNVPSDCWTAVNGSVYDLTAWIAQHPGGAQAIIGLCGIDGSSAFNSQHGGQAQPESALAMFRIGVLGQ